VAELFKELLVSNQQVQVSLELLPKQIARELRVTKAPSEKSASKLLVRDLKLLVPAFNDVKVWDTSAIMSGELTFSVSMEGVEATLFGWNSRAEEKVVSLVNALVCLIAQEFDHKVEVGKKRKYDTTYFQTIAPRSPRLFGSDDGVLVRCAAGGEFYYPCASLELKQLATLSEGGDWKKVGGQVCGPLADLCLHNNGRETFVILSNWNHWWFFSMTINSDSAVHIMKMCYYPRSDASSILRMILYILGATAKSCVSDKLKSIAEDIEVTGNDEEDGGENNHSSSEGSDESDDSNEDDEECFDVHDDDVMSAVANVLSVRNVNKLPDATFWFQKCHPSGGLVCA
jgi:hypothetical protein